MWGVLIWTVVKSHLAVNPFYTWMEATWVLRTMCRLHRIVSTKITWCFTFIVYLLYSIKDTVFHRCFLFAFIKLFILFAYVGHSTRRVRSTAQSNALQLLFQFDAGGTILAGFWTQCCKLCYLKFNVGLLLFGRCVFLHSNAMAFPLKEKKITVQLRLSFTYIVHLTAVKNFIKTKSLLEHFRLYPAHKTETASHKRISIKDKVERFLNGETPYSRRQSAWAHFTADRQRNCRIHRSESCGYCATCRRFFGRKFLFRRCFPEVGHL